MDAELVSYIEAKIAERKEAKKAKDFAKAMPFVKNCYKRASFWKIHVRA